jgi:hypothetical protein
MLSSHSLHARSMVQNVADEVLGDVGEEFCPEQMISSTQAASGDNDERNISFSTATGVLR